MTKKILSEYVKQIKQNKKDINKLTLLIKNVKKAIECLKTDTKINQQLIKETKKRNK